MRWPERPRTLRGRLLVVVLVAVGAALIAMTTAFNLVLRRDLSHDATEVAQARAAAARSALATTGGRIRVPDQEGAALETGAWVFAGGRLMESPRAGSVLGATARSLAGGPARTIEVRDRARLAALPVTLDGRRVGTVVAGVSLAPYERTARIALVGSLALAAVTLAAVGLVARWTLRLALAPVARMTRHAAEWSERDVDRRFSPGPPADEISRLAVTLNGMLDRLAAGLRRERRFSAEISHELRTPLSRVVAEADLALRRDRDPKRYRAALADVREAAGQMSRTIDLLMADARQQWSAPRGTADAAEAAERVAATCRPLARSRGVAISVRRAEHPVRVGVDPEVLDRILLPVVENACRYARGRVELAVGPGAPGGTVVVRDDGPGVGHEERERIFEPGARGRAGGGSDGAGLGLALARRLARGADGEVEAEAAQDGGRFLVRLPVA